MKKYTLTFHLRNGGTHKESGLTWTELTNRMLDFNNFAYPRYKDQEIASISHEEEAEPEQSFVFDIAVVSSIISGEYYRTLMIKTLLSSIEVSRLIAAISIEVYQEIKSRYPKALDPSAPQSPLLLQVTDLAEKMIWEKHNLKL